MAKRSNIINLALRRRIKNEIITLLILLLSVGIFFAFYRTNDYAGFQKAEMNIGSSKFSKDFENTHGKISSYKL
jgi:hypothetical protein